jgi:hypothetical protein
MYKIIGGDQKQYGPVSTDEVRAWIADGRLNAQSLAWTEGAADWKPLGAFPEFADALREKALPQPLTGARLLPGTAEVFRAEILARPSRVEIGRCFARSWRLVTENFGLLFGVTVIVWAISFGLGRIPLIGGFIAFLVRGPVYGGMYLAFLKKIRGEEVRITNLFSNIDAAGWVQLFLVGIVSSLLSTIATACCLVLPGIYLLVAWTFSIPLVADKRLEFWSAMELSRKVVTRVWFEIFGLLLIATLPLLVIALFIAVKLGLALFPTVQRAIASGQPDPAMLKAAIEHIIANSGWVIISVIAMNVVFLFVLPFLAGALAYAYEDLFGTGRAPSA